jgi:cysteine-S-conjugate beta-lyase
MDFFDQLDSITSEKLHSDGGTKWQTGAGQIGAFIAEMDYGIAPEITQALHRDVDIGSFGYFTGRMAGQLSIATASWLRRKFDWTVNPDDIKPVADIIRAYEFALEHKCSPGASVIVPTPAYPSFLKLPDMIHFPVIEVPMVLEDGNYTFDLDALQTAFDKGGELLVLCNPYNPGGRVFTREELEAICNLVDRNGGSVFADEIWSPLIFGSDRHIPYASLSNVAANHSITGISASKAWNLPGLKCAQVICTNESDRKIWTEIGSLLEFGTSNLGATATVAAYREGDRWLSDVVAYLDRNRMALADLVKEHLDGVIYHPPQSTYLGWLDFRQSAVAENPAAFFEKNAEVLMTEGTDCGGSCAGFARFVFATPLPIMCSAFERMGDAMRRA